MKPWPGIVERYRDRLDLPAGASAVTLLEGNTPLIEAHRLGQLLVPQVPIRLFLKYEGLNPTGSFKDRGMCTAVTVAAHEGATTLVCASTGNTAASAAAYAARAGMQCVVVVPDGNVALGKLAGAIAYGAKVVAIDGTFDDALRIVREASQRAPLALVNSVNPARIEGQKTAAWEVIEQLDQVPDWLALPVGNAGNITAYWRGFNQSGHDDKPRLLGTQAAGAAPLVLGHIVENPDTKCTAIRIGNPARSDEAKAALRESNGRILAATDDQIFEAQRLLAATEGVFCEPSSAAGLAGLTIAAQENPDWFDHRTIVAVLTGHGLKDPDAVLTNAPAMVNCPASTDDFLKVVQPDKTTVPT